MRIKISLLLVVLLLSIMIVTVQAQGTPLVYGSTVSGEINATTPQGLYTINGAEGDWITAYTIGTAPEFQPTLSLLGATGQVAFSNEDYLTPMSNDARISFRLPAAGAYSLLVGSFDATPGTYILALQSAIPSISTVLTEQPVLLNIPVNAPAQTYSIAANPTASSDITIASNTPGFGFTAQISDSDGTIIAVVDAGVQRAVFTVPAGTLSYEITIRAADPATTGEIAVSVTGAGVAPTTDAQPAGQPTQATVALPTDQCVAVPGAAGANVRSGPGETYDPIGGVAATGYVQILGQNNGWYAVNYFGDTGWVASTVVTANGPCGEIPFLAYGEQQPEVTETPEATESAEMTEEPEMTETVEMTDEPEVTEEANQAQVAPEDIDQSGEINIKQSGTQTMAGNISYPTGDTRDVVNFTITGFDSVTTFGDIQYTLFCNGDATNISASLGNTGIACNATQTIRAQGSNNQGTGNSSITFSIEYTGGEAQYVDWQLQITPQ